MEDSRIVTMLWERKEEALREISERFGPYCRKIAANILPDEEDIAEVLNDTWLGAWTSIPPNRPENLSAYLGRITRNLSCKKIRGARAGKRIPSSATLVYEELEECIPSGSSPEEQAEMKEVTEWIERFLDTLPKRDRILFVRRYWYFESIEAISREARSTESNVKTKLWRIRKQLKQFLEENEVL